MKKLFTIILFLLVTVNVSAQQFEAGLFGGGTYYNGDLNTNIHLKPFNKPDYGGFCRYNIDQRMAIKLGYMKGTIEGEKMFPSDPGIAIESTTPASFFTKSFETSINELSAQFEINFHNFSIDGEENRISPYVLVGVGLTLFKVEKDITIPTPIIPSPKLQNGTTVNFPIGVGVKFCPGRNITTGFECGVRKTFCNKLDNVFPDIEIPASLPYLVSTTNDWYAFAGIWVSFRLNFSKFNRCY
jgi:opacity protein-like surface antigen